MANPIEQSPYSTQSINLNASSRYSNSDIIFYGNNKQMTFTTYVRGTYPPTASDKFMVIGPSDEYRPDKVSQNAYGVPDYWWKIMEANNIFDIFDFKSGINIRLPSNIY